jgi:hypothetical protein
MEATGSLADWFHSFCRVSGAGREDLPYTRRKLKALEASTDSKPEEGQALLEPESGSGSALFGAVKLNDFGDHGGANGIRK